MADRPYGPWGIGRSPVEARGGMVATSQPLATQAGLRILQEGGSAADAALAAAAVLCVTEPMSTGLGGDAFVLGYDAAQGSLYGLNGSGPAPARADAEELLRRGETKVPTVGLWPVTVPGSADAWEKLHARYGVLPWKRILAPAIHYAREGFAVAQGTAGAWASLEGKLRGDEEAARIFLTPGGRAPRRGEVFRNPQLARTLETVVEEGPRTFYQGQVAQALVEECRRRGGWLEPQDLESYQAEWVEPVGLPFLGYQVWELPPNGQGIFALEILGILEQLEGGLAVWAGEDPKERAAAEGLPVDLLHALVEATRMALADRGAHLGDPRGGHPWRFLLSPAYLSQRAAQIRREQTSAVHPAPALKGGTVYLTAVDEAGNAVSFIQSLYMGFGSAVGVRGTGLVLHNRGAGFRLEEGHPGRMAPGLRPPHTIIPAMVCAGDEPYLSFGVMGGDMQIQGHAQVLLYHLLLGLDVQAAGEAPRAFVHPETGELALESGYPAPVRRELMRRGHRLVEATGVFGGYQAIRIDPETKVRTGASDPRKDGQAAGY
jgi:gamma-glutamyltranspeptidase/glutathione hydrolase